MKRIHLIALLLAVASTGTAQRLQQPLGRAVVAVNRSGSTIRSVSGAGGQGNLISWRKLAQEPEGTTYNVYQRQQGSTSYTKLNAEPLKQTNYVPATLTDGAEYAVSAITPDGVEGQPSRPFRYQKQAYPNVWFNFDFDDVVIRRNEYRTKFVWPMDLDGNGEYDAVVVDRLYASSTSGDDAEDAGDNTASTSHKLQAYKLDGTLLWTVDMGPNVNICSGQNDMVLAYDINCDGRCEVIVRSSDGTRFWDKQHGTWGRYVGGGDNADTDGDGITDYRTQSVKNPPFYISVINGQTGAELDWAELTYSELSDGSDSYSRNNRASYMGFDYGAMLGDFAIAYLDGIHPSLVMECEDRTTDKQHHGYVLSFDYNWTGNTPSGWHHSHTWVRNPKTPQCAKFHQIRVVDSDGDGCDELWAGGYGVNPAQDRFTSTGIGHGDRFVISDIDPDRPGIEGFAIQQSDLLGQVVYDARTGNRIKEWYLPSLYDVGRGTSMDVDPAHKGYEIFSHADDFIYTCKGEKTDYTRSGCGIKQIFEGVWWNGDLQREELSSPGGSNYGTNLMITQVLNKARLVEFSQESSWDAHAANGTRPAFMGDITGDWREEVILAKQSDNSSTGLVGYTTNMPTDYSIYCLQQDPHYRGDCTTRGYYQHPNTSFYLGGDMPMPPLPPVFESDVRNEMASGKSVMFDLQGDYHSPITVNHEPTMLYLMNPRGHDYTFSGAGTAGTGSLIKSLQGTATFNCDLGHTGKNIISEGTLCVNGTVSGPVELCARGTLSGNVTLQDTITFEGALNYEGCRLMPTDAGSVITSKRNMVLPGNVYLEVKTERLDPDCVDCPPLFQCGRIVVEGDLTFQNINYITVNLQSQDAAEYVIAECTGTLTCDVAMLKTRGLDGINYDLVVRDNRQLVLVVNATRAPAENVVWTGSESMVWDYKAKNFALDGSAETSFVAGDQVVFNAQAGQQAITLSEPMVTKGVFFDSGKYTLSGEGGISGEGDVTVNKDADVTLNMKNSDYTGKTIINGGTLTVPNFYDGGQKSAIGASTAAAGNLQINGGTLVLSKDNMATNHIVTLTDTATINISQSSSSLALKGQVRGTGYLVKDGAGQLNFTYGGSNPFAGVIVKKGTIAQGAWNSTFGRSGSPMLLAGGEVRLLDVNNMSTMPTFDYVTTIAAGTTNKIIGTSRGRINGTFLGSGNLTIQTLYVRCDVGASFNNFEGQLTALGSGGNFRLMSNVTDMSKTHLIVGAATTVAHYSSGSNNAATVTTKIGTLSSPASATDAVLGGSSSTYEIGYRNENSTFYGLLQAARIVKTGTGKLTLRTAGHTSPITVDGGTLELTNSGSTVLTSGLITVDRDGMLAGSALAQSVTVCQGGTVKGGNLSSSTGALRINGNLTLQSGATTLVRLGTSGNTRITVSGQINHNADTLLLSIPATRRLSAGDEITVYTAGFSSATGDVIIRCESADGTNYEFDTSRLNTEGKLIVSAITTGISPQLSADQPVDVFTPDGRRLRTGVSCAHSLVGLPSGTYVVSPAATGSRHAGFKVTKTTR